MPEKQNNRRLRPIVRTEKRRSTYPLVERCSEAAEQPDYDQEARNDMEMSTPMNPSGGELTPACKSAMAAGTGYP